MYSIAIWGLALCVSSVAAITDLLTRKIPNWLTGAGLLLAVAVQLFQGENGLLQAGVGLTVSALEHHCEEHLGKHKRPKKFTIVAELPKNFLGKIQRRKVRETVSNGHGHQP